MAPIKAGKYEYRPESLTGLRQQLALKQGKMAELLGIPANTLSRWETGATTPDAEALASIYSLAMDCGILPTSSSGGDQNRNLPLAGLLS